MAFSSLRVYTAPVGLQGEQRISPRTSLSVCLSRSSALTLMPQSAAPGIMMGSARARCTIWGQETQAGAGMSTLSLGPNRLKQALKRACLERELTTMLSAWTGRPPDKRERFFAIAWRRSLRPGLGGYWG